MRGQFMIVKWKQVVGAGLGAALAVGAVVPFTHARNVLAPAIAIAAVIVVAEIVVAAERERMHVRLDGLREQLARQRRPAGDRPPSEVALAAEPTRDEVAAPPRSATEPGPLLPTRQFQSTDRRHDDPQCPSCGRFSVDVEFGAASSTYRCRSCRAVWSVPRGAPWPEVRVVADLRKLERANP
jgi:ribosomal protein L37AE/L43A